MLDDTHIVQIRYNKKMFVILLKTQSLGYSKFKSGSSKFKDAQSITGTDE